MSIRNILIKIAWGLFSLFLTTLLVLSATYYYMETKLPSANALKNIQLQVPLKIYSKNNELIGQYGTKLRTPVGIDQIPKQLIEAVLATEDQRYFEHPGVDLIGLIRAAKSLATTGKKSQGASTITMQVARNFFLTRKKTYTRKFNEILLALKIDRELSKEKVLELYLNKIYFGQRAYGVAAAAQVYYGKSLSDLSLPQIAMLAGLPQSPSRNNPIANPKQALKRRNHVLQRMLECGYINDEAYQQAVKAPLSAHYHGPKVSINASYVAEMVRAAMVEEFGREAAYTQNFKVYTTIDSKLQKAANQALTDGLIAYDHRHGYRGPVTYLGEPSKDVLPYWLELLKDTPVINGLKPAIVLELQPRSATAMLADGELITIPWSGLSWARREINEDTVGPNPKTAGDILRPGDLIRIEQKDNKQWELTQIPKAQGAIVALSPNDGAITALDGGFNYEISHFNRITQAFRQPGSGFKPFIYSAALTKGYTLATVVNDAPIVVPSYGEDMLWRPHNDTYQFYGPTRLRVGLIKSRNLVSIRLLQQIGVNYALQYVKRFGFNPTNLPHSLSLALGSGATTPMQLIAGYAVFANGGYKVIPYFISQITKDNNVIYIAHPSRADNTHTAPEVISPQNAYLMTSALKSVILHGTGRRALVLKRDDLAGKTGTTNDQVDGWFTGFNRNLVACVWIGFDQPHSLHEYGASSALPIWIRFMKQALADQPSANLPQPPGIVTARIDPKTGLLAYPAQSGAIFEMFRQQYAPTQITSRDTQSGTLSNNETNNDNTQLF